MRNGIYPARIDVLHKFPNADCALFFKSVRALIIELVCEMSFKALHQFIHFEAFSISHANLSGLLLCQIIEAEVIRIESDHLF